MLLGRTKGDDTTHFSKNPALGTGSSAEPQLSTVEKSISDFQLTGNAIACLLLPEAVVQIARYWSRRSESYFPNTARRAAGVRLCIAWISLIKE
jgi:hypothetical protein